MTGQAPALVLDIKLLYITKHSAFVDKVLAELRRNDIEPQTDAVPTVADFGRALHADEYDVVLADCDTEAGIILQALQLLRASRKAVPFILLSDPAREAVAVEALKKGATDLVYTDRLARLSPAVHRALQEKMLREARIQAEAALRGANQVLTALIRCAPLPVMVLDRMGTVNVWNPAAEETLGWVKEEVLGKRLADVLPNGDQGLAAALLALNEAGGLRGTELRQQRKGGAPLDLRVFSAPLTDNENHVQGIIGMLTNVTEMNAMMEALRESRERFQSAFLYAPNGVALTDLEGRFLRVNPALCSMVGYPEAELVGLNWRALIHPDDLCALYLVSDLTTQQEVRVVCKQGQTAYVRWSTSVVRDAAGVPIYSISQVLDITEGKQAEEKIRQYAANLERSNSDLQHFAYVASHDLQEPLRMIRGFLDLLAKRYQGKIDATADEYIGYAVDGAARMQNLIRGLLAFSRVGTQTRSFSPVDTEDVLRQTLFNLEAALSESGALVTHELLPVVNGDGMQLAQLFQNLIGNAIKFRSEQPAKVHIRAVDKEQVWEFAVRDNGIGFDPAHANRIFQMFQRLHGPTKYEGTGIGLALCKRIVERHGGQIWADSAPGAGSTFFFTVPKNAAVSEQRVAGVVPTSTN